MNSIPLSIGGVLMCLLGTSAKTPASPMEVAGCVLVIVGLAVALKNKGTK